jgi:aspartyl-tRNA(Asn)/glutamyl-tRNA(Gln) amidotransferase subunit B
LLRTLVVSESNLEKGEMRVEPNISLSDDPHTLGTKVEVKNLNSFKSVEKAIDYELARMQALYEAGRQDEIVQETRGWDENKQTTFSQRSKENANDYRYFPDPDLPKMQLHSSFDIEAMKKDLPELPAQKRERYILLGIKAADAEVFVIDTKLATYIEEIIAGKDAVFAQTTANYIVSDLLGLMKKDPTLVFPQVEHFRELISMVTSGEITSRGAKDILAILAREGGSPKVIATEKGLLQENNVETLKSVVQMIIDTNSKIVADYKAGKESAIQGLVGQVMKETKGAANPAVTLQILKEML